MPPAQDLIDSAPQWYSLGACCQLLQVVPGQLYVLMRDVGVTFGQIVDDVPYLRGNDLLTVARRCGELRDEITAGYSTAERTAPSN